MSEDGTHLPVLEPFLAVCRRDLAPATRRRGEVIQPLIFFVVLSALFTLGVTPEPALLRQMGPGVIWVGALLATFMSLDLLFRSDFDDGFVDQMLLSPAPLSILVAAKVLVHWILTGVPLIVVSPLLAVFLALPEESVWTLTLTLLLGTPVLTLVGAIGTALTVGLKRGGALVALLVLPLYIPVLIFGAQAVALAGTGLSVTGQLYVLGAFLALGMALGPWAVAAALRISAA